MFDLIVLIFIVVGIYHKSKKKRDEGKESFFADRVDEIVEKAKKKMDKESDFSERKSHGSHSLRSSHNSHSLRSSRSSHNSHKENSYEGINERARNHIKEQEEAQTATRIKEEMHELTMDEIIRRKEEELRFGNESHHQEIPEEGHLMEIVSDLMVKGPNTEIPNERDFVGEAINSLHPNKDQF